MKIGTKISDRGHPMTLVAEYPGFFLNRPGVNRRWEYDLPESAEFFGRTYSMGWRGEGDEDIVDQNPAPITLTGKNVIATITLEAWVAAVEAARQGKDEASAEIAARGHILGRAAQILAHREKAKARARATSDQEVEDAAVHMHALKVFGHDRQSLERMRHGFGPTAGAHRKASPSCHFGDTLAEARAGLQAGAEIERQKSVAMSVLPDGWIDVQYGWPAGW